MGDQFDDVAEGRELKEKEGRELADPGNEWPEICGCTISVRQSEDIITVWNKVDGDARTKERIRCVLCVISSLEVR